MEVLNLTPRGEELLERLDTDPNFVLVLNKVVFSNLLQPTGDTILGGNIMYGRTIEGLLLISYKMLFSNQPTVVLISYIDRTMYTPDYVPRSFGIYTDQDELFAYGNLKPVDTEISVLTKTGIIFFDKPLHILDRVQVVHLYNFSIEDYVRSKLIGKSSAPSSTQPYFLFEINNNLQIVSQGLFTVFNGVTYKIFFDEDHNMLVGEEV